MSAQGVHYCGDEQVNIDYHDGQLRPAVGVQSYQVLRANREHPEWADGQGYTYNHAPMLAYWQGRFYLEYLSNPVGEHAGAGQTLLTTSADGRSWAQPRVVFPPYVVPDGVYRNDPYTLATGSYAVMHQRMGFYVAPGGRLLVLGFYGISPHPRVFPNDGRGIGRVVREIYGPDDWGPIHFIRYNRHAGWHEGNTLYPFYRASPDTGFVAACDALLADRLKTMQWWEEDRSEDGFFSVPGYQAPSVYHAADGRAVAMFKHSHTAISEDEGRSWSPVRREPSLVMSGAKVWGQRTSDGRYALVYNPSTHSVHRWPLAVITGDDGYTYDGMLRVIGEVPPRRYAGLYKDHGPQYVRGICEGNGAPPDGALWLTCSMNKEDIWVTRVPVPVRAAVLKPVADSFDEADGNAALGDWNVYSPLWAPVGIVPSPEGRGHCLELRDEDPCDYALAERVFPAGRIVTARLRLMAGQAHSGELHVELVDGRGQAPLHLWFGPDGRIGAMSAGDVRDLGSYAAGQWYDLELDVDVAQCTCSVGIPQLSLSATLIFQAPVTAVERLVLRTGARRRYPTPDTPTEADGDMPGAGERVAAAVYLIDSVAVQARPV